MPKKILVIEDDPSHEALLCRLIQSVAPDAEISSEESAERALEVLQDGIRRGEEFHLIIADVFLAGKATGIDLLQVLRELLPRTPVLISSSLPLLQYFSAVGRDSVAPTFLPKPLDLREGRHIIESMLSWV